MTNVAHFDIEYTRYIDQQGKVVGPLPEIAKDIATVKKLFSLMLMTRTFDTRAITLQRTGKLGTYASALGQEAIAVGVGHAMRPDDVLCPNYREYGAMLQRGIKMSEIFLYWGGDERGSNYQHNKQDLPICVPIASQCLHAAGVAKAFQLRREDRVAVAMIGDGGTSQGDFYEAINVVGCWNLPVVFIINNNQWAISVPLHKQTSCQTLAQKGIAGNLHCEQVDGNDVLAVRAKVGEAIERARQGKGGSVIECLTFRLCDHTTADDATRYINKKDIDKAWEEEPIKRLRQYLVSQNAWNDAEEQALVEKINQEVSANVEEYLQTAAPRPEAMLDYLYAELPDALALQYAELVEIGNQHA